jgi:acetyl-CoA carboxylase biotin carboxyl carrier protein
MANETPPAGEPFNLDQLKDLIELMEKHGLTEVHLRHGAEQWRLRRGGHETVQMVPVQQPVTAPAPSAPAATPAPAGEVSAAAPTSNLHEIKSPMVGTFYQAPSPEDPPYVTIGATVAPDTVVCQLEAMKVFEQISADCSGTIEEILVQNGDPVEHGQVLFRVKPA